ncbi:MAG TPA: hypothetical protein VL992_18005 [Tepidisphaeraceae bacterium]|nr:hypothetical protein [Tepidisphaeraceae bacterium]
MPPVSPQGSRGGLVAAVVTFTVLFVASTIFAIYYGVQDSKAEDTLQSLQSRYRRIAIDLDTPDINSLLSVAPGDTTLQEPTAIAEALKQRDDLRHLILGSQASSNQPADTSAEDVMNDTLAKARDAMSKAATVLGNSGAKFTPDGLLTAINLLTLEVQTLDNAVTEAQAEQNRVARQANLDSQAAHDAESQADTSVATAKQELQQQLDAANDAIKNAQDMVSSVRKTFEDEQAVSTTALDAADRQRTDLDNQLNSLKRQMDRLRARLTGRQIETADAIIRRPDGQIVDIADASTVYINLGQGDQIVPGMTFEVYDKTAPLPTLGDGLDEENLPAGKASIEVVRVLPHGSECHVSHVTPGQTIVQGDRILNLVYDRNVKFKFYVYGSFDVGLNGKPTPAGADVIKRLITQWGGQVVDKLDEQTDFVIMGSPPEVPIFTAEDLTQPLNAEALQDAKAASEAYDNVISRAIDLHVDIMNQNKFLYFTGYYDVITR